MTEKMFYSIQSASEVLELSDNTIKGLIYDKKLKAYKIGRQWRITRDDLINFVISQECNISDEEE